MGTLQRVPAAPPKRVLVVDDDHGVGLLTQILQDEGSR